MSKDIKIQVIEEIKSATFGLFSIQLDESTDVASCSQLLVFARYVHSGSFKEEFLFCSPLETTTKAADVLEKVSSFFQRENILWNNLCGCCTDGAPAMMGTRSGFQARVKELAPNVKGMHCMIHRQALASKTLPGPLDTVLEQVIKIVNFIKGGPLNSRLFKQLCADMDAEHNTLLFHTSVRWLSKGNVIKRVFELRSELKGFFENDDRNDFLTLLEDDMWNKRLAYLVDIFEQLNKVNLQMQGRGDNLIKFLDTLKAFVNKVKNWKRKIEINNFAMFEELSSIFTTDSATSMLPDELKNEIFQHLTALENEFVRYFPELNENDLDLVRNPFKLSVEKVPDDYQDEFLELQSDSSARNLFEEKSITEFWPLLSNSYPNITKMAFRILIPFASTYLCESGFSTLLQIKKKERSRLDVEDDMRCALSKTLPRIALLARSKQSQMSH